MPESNPRKVYQGKVIPPTKNPLSALDGFEALHEIVDAAKECFEIGQTEATKRARLRTYENTEIERIRAGERRLKEYFDQVFAERRSTYDELFIRLDRAMDEGNGEVVHAVLNGIVDVAKTSPIAQMGDLGQIRKALDDPDTEWEL